MPFNDTINPPAGWTTIRSARHCHLFLTTDALTFTLLPEVTRSGAPPTPTGPGAGTLLATSYEVRDYWGAIVASGSVSGTTLTLTALPEGWYKLYLRQAGTDATYGNLIGMTPFSVIATDTHLADPPMATRMSSSTFDSAFWDANYKSWYFADGNSNSFADHALRGITSIGAVRQSIGNASSPAAEIGYIQSEMTIENAWYGCPGPDAIRPRKRFVSFPNGGVFDAGQIAGVTASVAALYPSVEYFEGPANEPDLVNTADYVAYMQTFYNAVKAGNAAAKVIGPCPVSINGNMLPRLDAFFAAGGGNYIDAISFHLYNGTVADIPLGRRALGDFTAMLARYGLGSKELWQTEYGEPVADNGILTYSKQTQIWWTHRFMLDQYGVPKERDFWFYGQAHNFWSFASFYKVGDYARGDHSVMPMVPMSRVYSRELYGKRWVSAVDFGTVEKDHYLGNVFAANSGDQVIALMGCGRTDGSVTIETSPRQTRSVQIVGPFGDITSVTTDQFGRFTLALGMEPKYVRVPASIVATVLPKTYGTDVASWNATALADSQAKDARQKIIDGYLENAYGNSTHPEFQDTRTLPAAVTVQLPSARQIDTVIIYCPLPREDHSSLLDYDLEYQDVGGTWHTLQTVLEPANTVPAVGSWIEGQCTVDVFYSYRRIFVHEFSPVTAQAARITVRDVTRGHCPDDRSATAHGFPGSTKIRVREIALYSRDTQVPRPLTVI